MKNRTIKLVGQKSIEWNDGYDTVLITNIGKTPSEPIWLLNHIDVTENQISAEAIVCVDSEIDEYLGQLKITKKMLKKLV